VARPQGKGWGLGSASGELAKAKVEKKATDSSKDADREEAPQQPAPVAASPKPVATPVPRSAPPEAEPAAVAQVVSKAPSKSQSLDFKTSPRARNDDEDGSSAAQGQDALGPQQASELRRTNLEAARVSGQRNDRVSEIKFALSVLSGGASGQERLEALKRVCDAYESQGEYDRADPYCDLVLREYPRSAAADAISKRRNYSQRAREFDEPEKAPEPAKKAKANSKLNSKLNAE
jgi:hypothetical protein